MSDSITTSTGLVVSPVSSTGNIPRKAIQFQNIPQNLMQKLIQDSGSFFIGPNGRGGESEYTTPEGALFSYLAEVNENFNPKTDYFLVHR